MKVWKTALAAGLLVGLATPAWASGFNNMDYNCLGSSWTNVFHQHPDGMCSGGNTTDPIGVANYLGSGLQINPYPGINGSCEAQINQYSVAPQSIISAPEWVQGGIVATAKSFSFVETTSYGDGFNDCGDVILPANPADVPALEFEVGSSAICQMTPAAACVLGTDASGFLQWACPMSSSCRGVDGTIALWNSISAGPGSVVLHRGGKVNSPVYSLDVDTGTFTIPIP